MYSWLNSSWIDKTSGQVTCRLGPSLHMKFVRQNMQLLLAALEHCPPHTHLCCSQLWEAGEVLTSCHTLVSIRRHGPEEEINLAQCRTGAAGADKRQLASSRYPCGCD